MFKITNENDQNAWLEYKKEVNEWKSYKTRQKYWIERDMNGYEKMGRDIEDKWRVIFNDLEKQQNQKIAEEYAAQALIALSKVKIIEQNTKAKINYQPRRSKRLNKVDE